MSVQFWTYRLPVTSCDRNQNKLWPIWWALWLVCDLNYNESNDGVHWEISIGSNLVFLNEMLLFDFLHFMVVFTKASFFSSHLFVHTWKQKNLLIHTVTNNNDKSRRRNTNMWWNIWISRKKIVDWVVLLKGFWHVRNRCEWRNFYFDDVTEKVFEWSKNAYLVLSRWRIFWTSDAWIVFFFLLLLGKNHQILHINWGNTRQKWKLQTPPQFMNRFSCSFVGWNSISPH